MKPVRNALSRRNVIAGAASVLLAGPVAAQTAPLRFGAAGSESFDESFFLLDGGFLKAAGLSGDVFVLPNGARIMDAMVGGSMDIGMSDMLQVANAVNHGISLAFFAGGSIYDTNAPATVLCVARNSPLQTAKDLEGKTIALQGLKTLAEFSTREWLRANGADSSRVSFVETGAAAAVPSLLRGTVAATIVSEPFITAAGDEVRRFAKPYDYIAKSFYISSWYTTRTWLSANARSARKLQDAIYAAARWTNTHRDESLVILMNRLKLDPAKMKSLTRARFATTLEPKLMQPVLDIATKYALLDKHVDAATLIAHLA
ncbi:MAG TPA: ABC transporter substrate-binding protein [Candidatus Acidoferrales bacterium]|nr:ABC transporter substrate-binding protein [Candidatus Acidoferrales bacterium]